MSEEISNKTLAVIVVAAIVVTLGSTALILRMGTPVITGMATSQTGTASFNITSVTSIDIVTDTINWGNGSVDAGTVATMINTEGTSDNDTVEPFDHPTTGLVIQNDGNVNVSIDVEAANSSANFPGGNAAYRAFEWKTSAPSSRDGTTYCANLASYTAATTTNTTACTDLPYGDAADQLELDLRVVIPSDVVPGAQSNTITFHASQY